MKAKKILKVILGMSTCGMSVVAEKVIKSARRGNKVAQAGCAVVAGIMLIGVGGAMATAGEDPVTVVEDQEVSEVKDVPRETPVVKEFDPQEGLILLQTVCDEYNNSSDNGNRFDCSFKEQDGQKMFYITEYNSNLNVSDISTIEMALKLGKTSYDEVVEVMHWGDLKNAINNASIASLDKLEDIYPNDDIHVAMMFGTNEDHIYLTSLDGTIVYDVFAN